MRRKNLSFLIISAVILIAVCILVLLVAYPPEQVPTIDPGTTTPSATWTETAVPPEPTSTTTPSPASDTPTVTPTVYGSPTVEPTMTPAPTETPAVPAVPTITPFPNPYMAQWGDSLWKIALWACGDGRLWPVVWGHNPGIENPHVWARRLVYWGCQ